MIESVDSEYVSISVYSPLSGRTYIELPNKLKNPIKGLINTKNNDNKCSLWWHMRYLNTLKRHPERIPKSEKNMVSDLDYEGIEFPVSKKDFGKTKMKNNICINVLCYENELVHLSDGKFKNCIDYC